MQENIVKLLTIARNIWRFRWYAMLAVWILSLGGWFFVFMMPDKYESSARVYIDSDSILKPLLRGIAVESTDFRQQLGAMTSQLLSRPNLEKVMRMVDLDIVAQTPKEKEEILKALKKSIKLLPEAPQDGQLANIFKITVESSEAQVARNIVQSLLTIFLETAIGESREDTGIAQEFLEAQIKEYEARLEAAENRLMEFQRKNMGVLPNQGVGIFQRLQTARSELSQIELELLEATNRRNEIQRQIQSLSNSGQSVMTPGVPTPPSPLEARIATLQQRLDELQMKYTHEHPAVRETLQTLQVLQKQQEEKEKQAAGGESGLSANPVYQQLKIALSEVDAQIAGMKVRKNAYESRLRQLQNDVKTLPEVEAELQRLDRDYEINKQQYSELVKRRESAKLSEHAGETGEDVKFRVIDPPITPLVPVGPNRPLLTSGVLLAAIGGGLGLAFLLSQVRPVFYDRRSIQETIGLPVFGVVSRVLTNDLLIKRKMQFAAYLIIGIILIIVYGVVVYLHITGIDAAKIVASQLETL